MITIAQWKIAVCGIYIAIGLVFALAFLTVGLARMDPAARGASIGFRLLILSGVVALWPYLLIRWVRGERAPRPEHNAHRDRSREAAS